MKKIEDRCLSCHGKVSKNSKGLCRPCYQKKVKEEGFRQTDLGDMMTEEELDRLIEEQMKNLPPWWNDHVNYQRKRDGKALPNALRFIGKIKAPK